jgi:ABC-type multidrug transport system ATPase subunit
MEKQFDTSEYDRVVECCALKRDLQILPGGSECEIGEKGVSLSGGQKARIALARAVYRDADVYLIDDPFAAVDALVAKHIFENAICKELKGKTRILVTNHTFTLPKADLILFMKDGKLAKKGTYEELLSEGISLIDLMVKKNEENTDLVDPRSPEFERPPSEESGDQNVEHDKGTGKAVEEEERETGQVKLSVAKEYFVMIGIVLFSVMVIASGADQVCQRVYIKERRNHK